jgi:uncharacterized membrane protein
MSNEKRIQLNKFPITLLIILLLGAATVNAEKNINPNSLAIQIYADGSTEIKYVINPEPSKPQVNVSLFGDNIQNILVTDQDGLILDWETFTNSIQINSLGTKEVTISYDTTSLTNKTGTKWSISLTSPINVNYNLPTDAVLVGLSPTPISITIIDNQASITQPNGTSRISYLLGTTGTKEHALVLLNKAEETIQEANLKDLQIDEAETLLEQARTALSKENYSQSEQYSKQATEIVQEKELKAIQAENSIKEAESLLVEYADKRDAQALSQAEIQLNSARNAYTQGDYETAKTHADESIHLSNTAPENKNNNMIFIAVALIVVIAGALIYWKTTQKTRESKPVIKQVDIDIDLLFKKHPHLRTDEKAVLRYVYESGGVFVTEIRERFDIPKSSTWRMMKRLEEQELITTKMVGRETHVQIKPK